MTQLVLARQSAGTPENAEFSDERLLNMYVRAFPDGGTSQMLIKQTDGTADFADLGTRTPVRAMIKGVSKLYAVSGARLWEVSSTGVATELGAVADAVNTSLFENDNGEIGIAAGGTYYQWDGSTLSTVSMNALTAVQSAAYLDGYGILADTVTDRFQLTQLNDADNLDALFFASSDALPDGLVAVVAYQSFVWLFGARSTEVWRNNGGSDFPLQRMSGAVIERGCFGPKTVATDDQSVFFVGDDKVVYGIQGTQPARISTHAVERALQDYDSGDNLVGLTWTESGHKFYALRFEDRPAWVYDISTGVWAERSTSQASEDAWFGVCATRAFGRQIVGGDDGKIYEISPTAYTERGVSLRRLIQAPPIIRGTARARLAEVHVNARTGAVDIGREPQIALQHSINGRVYGPEQWRGLGLQGDYDRLLQWRSLGQARQHWLRLVFTDPAPLSIYGGTFRLT